MININVAVMKVNCQTAKFLATLISSVGRASVYITCFMLLLGNYKPTQVLEALEW